MGVFSRLHKEWSRFVKAPAGERFRKLHAECEQGGLGGRVLRWSLGLLAILAGMVMIVTPGPGLLTIAFGVALIARESIAVARRCDGFELTLRRAWTRFRRRGRPADRD